MPTQTERLAVVETKVANIEDKVDILKGDVRDLHDCLDRTREHLDKKLDDMLVEYRVNRERYYQVLENNKLESEQAHQTLESKISNLEKIKTKGTILLCSVLAFIAGTGYLQMDQIAKVIKALAI